MAFGGRSAQLQLIDSPPSDCLTDQLSAYREDRTLLVFTGKKRYWRLLTICAAGSEGGRDGGRWVLLRGGVTANSGQSRGRH